MVAVPVVAVAGGRSWPGVVVVSAAIGFGVLPHLLLLVPAVVLGKIDRYGALPAVRQTGRDLQPAVRLGQLQPDRLRRRSMRAFGQRCSRVREAEYGRTSAGIPGFAGVPVLALDSTGRPLITGTRYEHGNPFDSPEYGLLLSCRDKSCRQRDEVNLGAMGRGFGANDMIVGPGDLPQIIWAGARSSDDDNQLHVTTCHQPHCGAR